jgi:hypothetical protein
MPALNAARTALIFEIVRGIATATVRCLREFSSALGAFVPRRFCSSSTAASNRSSSRSSRSFIISGRLLGRTYRAEGASELIVGCFGFANGAEHPSADGVEKRSGSSERMRLIPMDAIMPLPIRAGNDRIIR